MKFVTRRKQLVILLIQCSSLMAAIFLNEKHCENIELSGCGCILGENFKVSCPKDSPKIVIQDDERSFPRYTSIQCTENNGIDPYVRLPHSQLRSAALIQFDNCSITNGTSIQSIFEKLGLQTVQWLAIDNREVNVIPARFFAHLPHIEKLTINCMVETLPEGLFDGTTNLSQLYLGGNNLKLLPRKIFEAQTKLIELDLQKNAITSLPDGLFDDTINLIKLRLSFNELQQITEELLRPLAKLKELYLDHNQLHSIHQNAFRQTKELNILDLSHNQIDFEHYSAENSSSFDSLTKFMESLSPTTYFSDFLYTRMLYSNEYSHLKTDQKLNFTAKPIFINLSSNRIRGITSSNLLNFKRASEISKQNANITNWMINLNDNPFECDCSVSEFIGFLRKTRASKPFLKNFEFSFMDLKCKTPDNFRDKFVSEIDENDLLCQLDLPGATVKYCPPMCNCGIRFIDRVVKFDCSNVQLTGVPPLPNGKMITKAIMNVVKIPDDESLSIAETTKYELNIENNQITTLPALNEEGYGAISNIFARNNSIDSIAVENLSKNLSFLDLSYNKLERLSFDVLANLNQSGTFDRMILENNSLTCDCYSASDIWRFPQLFNKLNFENLICSDGELFKDKNMICPVEDGISTWSYVLLAIVSFSIGAIVSIYYKKQQEIHVWLFAHNCCLWLVTEDELDKDKKFDAFISFSHKDERFVTEVLLPELEKEPNPFKICVHFRDWTVGHFIPDQIAKSVEDSRRTIIVLSPNFLESIWGLMELRVAHQNALAEKRTRVIVILRGDIGKMDDLDPELKAYLTTNTYLEWNDPRFFDKLRYALPHPTYHTKSKNATARYELLSRSEAIDATDYERVLIES